MNQRSLFGFQVLILFGLCLAGCKPQTIAYTSDPQIFSAEDFTKEFLVNGQKAIDQYRDKRVIITGEVSSVGGSEDSKEAIIYIKGSEGSLVSATLQPLLRMEGFHLARKQMVKVTGKVATIHTKVGATQFVSISDCAFEGLVKSEINTVSAEDIAKEFATDAIAAKAKYDGKDVIVSGRVEELQKGNLQIAKLKGDGKLRVSVKMIPDRLPAFLETGHSVRLHSTFNLPEIIKNEVLMQDGLFLEIK